MENAFEQRPPHHVARGDPTKTRMQADIFRKPVLSAPAGMKPDDWELGSPPGLLHHGHTWTMTTNREYAQGELSMPKPGRDEEI